MKPFLFILLVFVSVIHGGLSVIAAEKIPLLNASSSITETVDDLADLLGFPKNMRPRDKARSIVFADDEVSHDSGASTDTSNKGFGLLINFDFDKAVVLPSSIPNLDLLGELLKSDRAEGQTIIIEGHTDAVGAAAYNQKLSEMRALAVRRYLVSVHGIDSSRLHPVGKGETSSYDSFEPTSAINRRVEFRRLNRR